MNTSQYPIRQDRLFAAAIAALATTLVLSSVIGLFASVGPMPASASAAAAPRQPVSVASVHTATSALAASAATNRRL
jgi:hypothetical protein